MISGTAALTIIVRTPQERIAEHERILATQERPAAEIAYRQAQIRKLRGRPLVTVRPTGLSAVES